MSSQERDAFSMVVSSRRCAVRAARPRFAVSLCAKGPRILRWFLSRRLDCRSFYLRCDCRSFYLLCLLVLCTLEPDRNAEPDRCRRAECVPTSPYSPIPILPVFTVKEGACLTSNQAG